MLKRDWTLLITEVMTISITMDLLIVKILTLKFVQAKALFHVKSSSTQKCLEESAHIFSRKFFC